jgi:ACS family hexuronate transporter-like MFS transporter
MLRSLLGFGESANFPACNKATAEWFPPVERATAMGVVLFGTNLANIIGPPLFIWITVQQSWQMCFAIIGGIGFLWVPLWWFAYRLPRQTGAIPQENVKISIKAVLQYRQAWGYGWAKFLTDPVWWFYLFWLPTYLNDVRHFSAEERAVSLTVIYAVAGFGAMAGGATSSFLIHRGWQVGKARKTAMLIFACIMPASGLGVVVESSYLAVLLFSIGVAAHSAWMANLFTTPADVFPKHAVGSANAVGVFSGAMGGALFSGLIPGYVIPVVGYVPVLLTMSCFYLVAWLLVHRLMGNMDIVTLAEVK